MELKNFQKKVIKDIRRYCQLLNEEQDILKAYTKLWEEKNVTVGFNGMQSYRTDISRVPHVCVKVPTGGGKTFIACASIKELIKTFNATKKKVVMWLVPSDTILEQTLINLKNTSHPYRQRLEADFNGRVAVYSKAEVLNGQNFNPTAINEQLSIIVMSFDSFRIRNKEDRKVNQENGYLAPFVKFYENRDTLVDGVDETAMIQVINQMNPIVIVDEGHNAVSDLSIEMLKNLNPAFILDLTATPRTNSNIISFVDAMQLKKENMVKIPVFLYNFEDKNEVVANAVEMQRKLELKAIEDEAITGRYIRPIILFQAEPKNADNSKKFIDLKNDLIKLDIPKEQIAIKTAEINDIKGIDLLSKDCPIRFIITINALKEGWDCPFAYVLASLANKTSKIDVEQILGRVLRLPYTTQTPTTNLNLSYVLTASNDFRTTVEQVIKGLNSAGFTQKRF